MKIISVTINNKTKYSIIFSNLKYQLKANNKVVFENLNFQMVREKLFEITTV